MKRLLPLVALALLAAACSISGSDDTTTTTTAAPIPGEGATTTTRAPLVDFELRDLGDGLVVGVPVGWTAPDPSFPRIFRPPEDSEFDRDVTLWWVEISCGGSCEARSSEEWQATVAAGEFVQFADLSAFEILRDEQSENARLVLAENNFSVTALTIARWDDGASAYLACRASTKSEDAELLEDFEKVCREAESAAS